MSKYDGIKWLATNDCRCIRPATKEMWEVTTVVLCKFPFPMLLFNSNYPLNIEEEFIDYVRNPFVEVGEWFDKYEFKRRVIPDKPGHYIIFILFNGNYDGPIEFGKFSMYDICSQYEKYAFLTDIKNPKNKKILDLYNKYGEE